MTTTATGALISNSTPPCAVCGHGRMQHMPRCQMMLALSGSRGGMRLCGCPQWMTKTDLEVRHVISLDWKLNDRLLEYMGGLTQPVPTKVSVIRTAIDEYLKGKGY